MTQEQGPLGSYMNSICYFGYGTTSHSRRKLASRAILVLFLSPYIDKTPVWLKTPLRLVLQSLLMIFPYRGHSHIPRHAYNTCYKLTSWEILLSQLIYVIDKTPETIESRLQYLDHVQQLFFWCTEKGSFFTSLWPIARDSD